MESRTHRNIVFAKDGRMGVFERGFIINSKGKKIKYPFLKGRTLNELRTDISSEADFFIRCLDKKGLSYKSVFKHWCKINNFEGKTFVDFDLCAKNLLPYFC